MVTFAIVSIPSATTREQMIAAPEALERNRFVAPTSTQSPKMNWVECIRVASVAHDQGELASDALNRSKGKVWCVLLEEGDELHPNALADLSTHLAKRPDLSWLYTDAEVVLPDGSIQAVHQPDIGTRLLRSGFVPYGVLAIRHDCLVGLVKSDTLKDGGLSEFNWRQILFHTLLSTNLPSCAQHVAQIMVRHRQCPSSSEIPELLSPPAFDWDARPFPLVSIIIPTRDQQTRLQRCIESVFAQTPSIPFELILVQHEGEDPAAQAFVEGLPSIAPDKIQVLNTSGDFNFARLINLGTARAKGDFLLLLNNDTAALHPEWLENMLVEMADDSVGIVGPRLVFPDGRIQHAGAVLGLNGAADFPWIGSDMDDPGYLGLLQHAREVSAVTGAALLIRRGLFEQLEGIDETFSMAYGDIDLCLRAQDTGYKVIFTPHSTLMHEAGVTLKSVFNTPQVAQNAQVRFEDCKAALLRRWLPRLARDPYYNVNLSLTSRRFERESHPALQPFVIAESCLPRVMALPADDSGSGEYRVGIPARLAAEQKLAACRIAKGYPLPVLIERLGINTLFSQRQVDDNHLTTLATLRELMPHLRVVMDFDDLLTEVSQHSIYRQSIWKDMPRRLRELARLSNCFTVSTEPLAAAMRKVHEHVVTIHNGIDPAQWAHVCRGPRDRNRKLRVGWVGGYSHAGDLALIRQVVATLSDEVDWIMLGMCLEETKPYLKEFHPAVPYAEYPAKFASLDLDLALAPLEVTHFNECKSNLRLLENGILGIPVIATDITPYQCGLPVTRVKNDTASWIRAIRERIGEFDALATEGETLRKAVLADWTIQKMLPEWLSAWQ